MTTGKRYIGINQRLPIAVIDNALHYLLRGDLQLREEIMRDLSEHFEGQNRLGKAIQSVNRIILGNPIAQQIPRLFDLDSYQALSKNDKKALYLALLAGAYPFVFDVVNSVCSILEVQPLVNSTYLQEKISGQYGSNRATFVGFYAIMPMLLELELIERPKTSLYQRGEKHPLSNSTVKEFYIQAYLRATAAKTLPFHYLNQHAWFFLFDMGKLPLDNLQTLNFIESGYSSRGVFCLK